MSVARVNTVSALRRCLNTISRSILIEGIRNKITVVFKPNDNVYNFFNSVYWESQLNCLAIKRNVILDYSKFFWSFFLRKKMTSAASITRCPDNNTCFFYFWKDAVTKLTFFFRITYNLGVRWADDWFKVDWVLNRVNRLDVSQSFSKTFSLGIQQLFTQVLLY